MPFAGEVVEVLGLGDQEPKMVDLMFKARDSAAVVAVSCCREGGGGELHILIAGGCSAEGRGEDCFADCLVSG